MGRDDWACMLPRALLVTVLAAVAATPAAEAHTDILSADGRVRASVGLLGEPVATHAVTGLDVCFTHNGTAASRPALAVGAPGAFQATLRAPGGARHTASLEVQHGRPHCLTFADPLVLTQPGQYLIDLAGSLNGTTFSATGLVAAEPVVDQSSITFPDARLPPDQQMQDRIAALESRIATLEAAAQEPRGDQFAPGPPPVLLLASLAALVAFLRRA